MAHKLGHYVGLLRPFRHSKLIFRPCFRSGPPLLTKNPLQYFIHLVKPYSASEKAGLARSAAFNNYGRGYSTEQSTKPQTLGYSLSDSPVGLLAWIYEKLVDWSDKYPWADDEGPYLLLPFCTAKIESLSNS